VFSAPDLATISHEVAHQWFYGIVGNDQFREPWLDESITSFHEQRFSHFYECDIKDPLDGAPRGLKQTMAYWDRHPDRYQDTIYRGGACALMRLEHDIGRRAMYRVLQRYVGDRLYRRFHLGPAHRGAGTQVRSLVAPGRSELTAPLHY
jgi:aminopeptidase N